jgi:hypothetical protein
MLVFERSVSEALMSSVNERVRETKSGLIAGNLASQVFYSNESLDMSFHDKEGIIELRFSGKCDVIRANSPLFELARVLVRFNHVAHCIVNAKLSYRTLPENAFTASVNFVEISLCASVARSPIATTFSCSELAAAGYCILAQEHQKQADRPTA